MAVSVILITGCSSGFGLSTAARLSTGDYIVYASMRNLQKRSDLLEEVNRRGGKVELLELDVTDDATIGAALKRIEEEAGGLHVLINNAGYAVAGFFEDLTEKEIRDQMETNFFGVQKVTRHALPLMRETVADRPTRRGSKIINVSSSQGRSPMPALSAYASSKFALEAFSESLSFELHPFGIHVVLVEPGSYRTKIFSENARQARRAGDPDSPYTSYARMFQAYIKGMLSSKNQMGDPETVAALMERIVNHPHPRLRYLIGGGARLRVLARRVLPFHWFAAVVRKKLFGNSSAD